MTDYRNRIKTLEYVDANELVAHPGNWRSHPAAQAQALKGVLNEVGIAGALLAYRSERQGGALVVIDGHLRKDAAPQQWPVLILDVDDAEADYLLATHDPLAAMATADAGALDALLSSVQSGEEAVTAMLAELAESAGLYAPTEDESDAEPQIDRAEELREQWGVEPGQMWRMPSRTPGQEHRLICGDCTNAAVVERVMEGEKADMVFTSPPYAVGVDYGETYEDTIEQLRAMLPALSRLWLIAVVDGGYAVINFGDVASGRRITGTEEPCEYPMAVEYWPVFRADGWLLWSRRVWCKPNPRVHSPWCIQSNRAATDWEHLWTFKKPGDPIMKRIDGELRSALGWYQSSLMHGVDVGKSEHGAGMALGIAEWMINIHSRANNAILEPFTGTGTTIIATENLSRQCRAVEISPAYVAVALQRYADAFGITPELINGD